MTNSVASRRRGRPITLRAATRCATPAGRRWPTSTRATMRRLRGKQCLLTMDEARRITANIAKLPELVYGKPIKPHGRIADQLKQKARLAVKTFSPLSKIDLGLNENWLNRSKLRRRMETCRFQRWVMDGLIDTIGAFLGKYISARPGCAWEISDDRRCCIRLRPANALSDDQGGRAIRRRAGRRRVNIKLYDVCVEFAANGELRGLPPRLVSDGYGRSTPSGWSY